MVVEEQICVWIGWKVAKVFGFVEEEDEEEVEFEIIVLFSFFFFFFEVIKR